MLAARKEKSTHEAPWTMEDHLRAMAARVDHMEVLGKDVPLAAIAAFRALRPDKVLPKKVSELCTWVKAALPHLYEWRESAGRAGLDTALKFFMSWYKTIDLRGLRTIRTSSKYVTNENFIRERQETACGLLHWAHVHTYFRDIRQPESEGEEEEVEDSDDEEDGDDADEGELLIARQHRLKQPVVNEPASIISTTVGTSSSAPGSSSASSASGTSDMDLDPPTA